MNMKRTALAAGLAVGVFGASWAGTPATGLGQAWPNAPDVSLNPSFHAYVFMLGGIRYIQINDAAGHVLGSVGTSGGEFIVLPIGRFSNLVATPQQAPAAASTAVPMALPTIVYNDGTTTITATRMSDGTTMLTAVGRCGDPASCGGHRPGR